ncbi:hypothetical protein MANES_04G153450v8 [Manihot esculenta]|uniref:Uncharacterized protein n=1 Tax=Manihot esculenta TaxID=3983 RepID=A0ACB7HYA4_MANES|nr:hypothetical protein MANES_04G153450v8 [Manihot esculenta]
MAFTSLTCPALKATRSAIEKLNAGKVIISGWLTGPRNDHRSGPASFLTSSYLSLHSSPSLRKALIYLFLVLKKLLKKGKEKNKMKNEVSMSRGNPSHSPCTLALPLVFRLVQPLFVFCSLVLWF